MTFYTHEEWRPIKGFPNYEVSSMGRVRSLPREEEVNRNGTIFTRMRAGRMIRPGKQRGYRSVALHKNDGVQYTKYIHRLVAQAFLGKPPSKKHLVMHRDDDGSNNRVSNLQWGTSKENSEDMVSKDRQLRGERNRNSKITEKTARKIGRLLNKGLTCRAIAESLPVSMHIVKDISKGKTWSFVTGRGL